MQCCMLYMLCELNFGSAKWQQGSSTAATGSFYTQDVLAKMAMQANKKSAAQCAGAAL